MKLIYKHGEARHFKITTFPDGQHNIILDLDYFNDPKTPVTIDCSIRTFTELEILCCIVASLRSADLLIDRINFLYLFGLRSDRKFENGSCNYVEKVLAPIIRLLCEQGLLPPAYLIPHGRSSNFLYFGHIPIYIELPKDFRHMLQIAGDISAIKLARSHHHQTLHFNKERRLSGMSIGLRQEYQSLIKESDLPILIVDDMCDGGATFIAEAEYLRDSGIIDKDRKLNLFVYHGIFSKGFDELFKHFDKIYTTNSYQPFYQFHQDYIDRFHIIDVWSV